MFKICVYIGDYNYIGMRTKLQVLHSKFPDSRHNNVIMFFILYKHTCKEKKIKDF